MGRNPKFFQKLDLKAPLKAIVRLPPESHLLQPALPRHKSNKYICAHTLATHHQGLVRKGYTLYRASQKKVGFRISNSPVVWDDQRLTKLTDTAQQLPPPPAIKNLEFPKRNWTSNFGFWSAPKILYAVRMSLRRYPKFYIFRFLHFLAVFGQNKIGHSKSS